MLAAAESDISVDWAMGVAQRAIPGSGELPATTTGVSEIDSITETLGWKVSSDSPGRGMAARVIDSYVQLDLEEILSVLPEYARAAMIAAAADLTSVGLQPSRMRMSETVVVGTVLGDSLWAKPLKFALSIGIYALTLSWLIGQLHRMHRMHRLTRIAGTVSVSVTGLVIEVVIIVGAAALGDTNHFTVSTPLHSVLWSVMALSIVVVWLMTLVVGIALFRNPLGDRAKTPAIRPGGNIALVGMGLAILMTAPTAQQLDDFQGIAGAHAVGAADGSPGLFLLGWSTVAGDLRIPHFVGMHAYRCCRSS